VNLTADAYQWIRLLEEAFGNCTGDIKNAGDRNDLIISRRNGVEPPKQIFRITAHSHLVKEISLRDILSSVINQTYFRGVADGKLDQQAEYRRTLGIKDKES